MFNHLTHFVSVILLALAIAAGANAAEPTSAAAQPATGAAVDAEEQIDQGLKRFGYLAGLVRGCVIEAQRPAVEREALELNSEILRLLGADRAFLFSSSFGHGTAIQVETKDCPEVIETYDARVASHRAGRGETD